MYLKNRSEQFILLQKIGNAITARECLTETGGFALGEILFKSNTGRLPRLYPLNSVFICKKKSKTSVNDFHVKSIVKEGERSCYHKTYFSTRELSCVFILLALNILKFEAVGVHF